MCYTNILQVLDLSGIPMLAADRGEDDPIVIGGGPCAYNPEPLADFFDIFYIGEGETVYDELLDAYKKNMACPRCLVCVHYHLISEFFHRKTCRFSKQQAFLVYTSPVIATGALIYSGYGRGIPLCVRFSDW